MDQMDPKTNNTTQTGAVETSLVIARQSAPDGTTRIDDKNGVMIVSVPRPLTRPEVELIGDVWWALRVRLGIEARQESIRQTDASGAPQVAAKLQEAMIQWILSLRNGV